MSDTVTHRRDELPDEHPGLGQHRQESRCSAAGSRSEDRNLFPISVEEPHIVVDPLQGHGHVHDTVVTGGILVCRA